jgi:hypothetical protein
MINSLTWLVDKENMIDQMNLMMSELELEGNVIEEIRIRNEKGMKEICMVYLDYKDEM